MTKENENKIEENQKSLEEDSANINEEAAEISDDDKFKDIQDKLLRALAETENQRRRFEKETKEAFEYGGFNLARETLSVLDNLQRAYQSIKNDESFRWIIDPIDGTSNFLHGIPHFAISIGLESEKEIICGIVYDPIKDEMFIAEKGNG